MESVGVGAVALNPLDMLVELGHLSRLGSPPAETVDESVRVVLEALQQAHIKVEEEAAGGLAVGVLEKRPAVGWHRASESAEWAIAQQRGENLVARQQLELRLCEAMLSPYAADRTRSVEHLLAVERQRLEAQATTVRARALHGAERALGRGAV
jgi:hypothetical protein